MTLDLLDSPLGTDCTAVATLGSSCATSSAPASDATRMTSNTASPSAAPSDETNADADERAERLRHARSLGAGHFIKDFGHPLGLASALRFVELVIAPK